MSAPTNPLPREIAPGVLWLGECTVGEVEDRRIHTYNAAFVVVGERDAAFIETGITGQSHAVLEQLDALQAAGRVPDPRYVLVTHSESAHSGTAGRLLARYPQATVHGDVSDLHLVFPDQADRQHFSQPGDRFDLGGRELVVVESVFRDLPYSRWYFDTTSKALFVGDGFAYSHWHDDEGCGRFVEETPSVDVPRQMARFGQIAFHWTQFVDIEPYIARLDAVLEELDVQLIVPTHGLPIGDLAASMPTIRDGFRAMSTAGIGSGDTATTMPVTD